VSHLLLRSSAFVRDSKRLLRKRPDLADQLQQTLQLLEADPQAGRLKTHKLNGETPGFLVVLGRLRSPFGVFIHTIRGETGDSIGDGGNTRRGLLRYPANI